MAAKVLAELGDPGGYELAERVAREAANLEGAYRCLAVDALRELAKLEDSSPSEQFCPTLALCALGDSDDDPKVLRRITTAAFKLGGSQAIDIFSSVRSNPHLPQDDVRLVERTLAQLRKKHAEGPR